MNEVNDGWHPSVIRKIRRCKSCKAKCNMKEPVVGCESIMIPMPPLKLFGKTANYSCERRIWFDKDYFPVEFWRVPTEKEQAELKTLPRGEWHKKLRQELKKLQEEAKAHGRRTS